MNGDMIREEILKARQSAVSKAGNDWENYVENFLKDSFEQILKTSKDDELKKIIGDIEVQRMGKKKRNRSDQTPLPKII